MTGFLCDSFPVDQAGRAASFSTTRFYCDSFPADRAGCAAPPSTVRPGFFLGVILFLLCGSGCILPEASMLRGLKATTANVKTQVERNTSLLHAVKDQRAGRDINTSDFWGTRLQWALASLIFVFIIIYMIVDRVLDRRRRNGKARENEDHDHQYEPQ